MRGFSSKGAAVGQRVEIPAYCDLWMRGARLGVIHSVRPGRGNYLDPRDPRASTLAKVRLDHPQVKRLAIVHLDDCRTISSEGV